MDRIAIEEMGVPGVVLMENAGLRVLEAMSARLGSVAGLQVVVAAGRGNNGGDGFVVARHLANLGAEVTCLLAAPQDQLTGDAKVNADAALRCGLPVREVLRAEDIPSAAEALRGADVIVDALLGTGISGKVRQPIAGVIEAINASRAKVVAVDLPSGTNSDTGEVCGSAVRADWTVTLALPKRGLFLYPGADYAGEVFVGDIGMPHAPLTESPCQCHVATPSTARGWLPARRRDAHKGDCGRVVVVGGSVGLSGAVALTARAALRAGAGLVTMATPASINTIVASAVVEATSACLAETEDHSIALTAIDKALELLSRADVLALGPGLSRHEETAAFAREIVARCDRPTVIDADGVVAIAGHPHVVLGNAGASASTKRPVVMTPHPGEMAALLGLTVSQVQGDRIGVAQQAAREHGAIVALKGAFTVIASPNGETMVNTTGNAGLATGGTGDVLTGTIAGLIAQGVAPFEAAALGCYLHGLAGDLAAARLGEESLIAGDLCNYLPLALSQLREGGQEERVTPHLLRLR